MFRLAGDNDVTIIDKILQKRNSKDGSAANNIGQSQCSDDDDRKVVTNINITDDGPIGIKFATSSDSYGLIVSEFLETSKEKYPGIEPNYFLSHVNSKCVLGDNGSGRETALRLLESEGASRPLSLGFVKPYLYNVTVEKGTKPLGGPSELILSELKPAGDSIVKENKIVLNGFSLAEGAAETGKVFVGDNLVFINGIPVGAGCRLTDGRKAKCPSLGRLHCKSLHSII